MTIRTVKTSEQESAEFHSGRKMFFIRSDKEVWNIGDIISFMVYKDRKPVLHHGEDRTYVVTGTYDRGTAPLETGYQIVSFRNLT